MKQMDLIAKDHQILILKDIHRMGLLLELFHNQLFLKRSKNQKKAVNPKKSHLFPSNRVKWVDHLKTRMVKLLPRRRNLPKKKIKRKSILILMEVLALVKKMPESK